MSKIVLNGAQDVPLNKLVLSQANVRRIKAGVSIEELAEDIARRGLLQSLSVRPVLDGEGQETGTYEVPAGGRRFEALKLLAKQKRLSKTAPVPCILRTDGIAEEDSLAENTMREALHPLDQFRAFRALREDHGLADDEIAARFFVTPAAVRQRLKLVAASPKLLDLYASGDLALEQLMAFCITGDHGRQEQVWEALSRGYNKEPYTIRRLLTESSVRASDRRAMFVGVDAYEAAGGVIARDLFQQDGGGWFEDVPLLDRLVRAKLDAAAEEIRAEGWKWIEAAPDFPYGHTTALRRLDSSEVEPSEAEAAEAAALRVEYDALEAEHANSSEDLPEDVDARLAELEAALARFEERPHLYDPNDVVRAGAFVSVDAAGQLRIERGFVRREDEAPVAVVAPDGSDDGVVGAQTEAGRHSGSTARPDSTEPAEEEDGLRPLPERLLTELTMHRTLALRNALANDPEVAHLAVLHALALKAFYRYGGSSSLEIEAKSASLGAQASDLADSAYGKALAARHEAWAKQLPQGPDALWDTLSGFDGDSREALFAHSAAVTVNAVHEPWNRSPGRLAAADRLAGALGLDMAEAGWTVTAASYLGRVTKARILEAVREAKGEASAQLIDHLKKSDMANEAERLLAGMGWVPNVLRTPGLESPPLPLTSASAPADAESEGSGRVEELPAFLTGDPDGQDVEPAQLMAAE